MSYTNTSTDDLKRRAIRYRQNMDAGTATDADRAAFTKIMDELERRDNARDAETRAA